MISIDVYFHETVCTSKHCTDSDSDTHSNQPIEFKPNRTDVIHDWPVDRSTNSAFCEKIHCTCRLDLEQANLTTVWLLGLLVSDLTYTTCTRHLNLDVLESLLICQLQLNLFIFGWHFKFCLTSEDSDKITTQNRKQL
jgi:hypothetical protein